MESKNPLEEIREAIHESRIYGVENDITQMRVSDELLKISDALDKYYGIVRESELPPSNGKHAINDCNVYTIKPNPYISSIVGNPFGGNKFSKTKDLLHQVKEPLKSIKAKLSSNDSVYLNISSTIVSIALRDVVSSVNSYQKTSYYDYKRYDPLSGVDNEFRNLIFGGLDVFIELSDFDMTNECVDNYEANRKTILSMAESIRKAMLHPSSSSKKSSSSGCIFLALTLLSSIVTCFGVFVLLII